MTCPAGHTYVKLRDQHGNVVTAVVESCTLDGLISGSTMLAALPPDAGLNPSDCYLVNVWVSG